MKLGINTGFLKKFDFATGLKWCQNHGVVAAEVSATGDSRPFCDVEQLLGDRGELDRWLAAYAAHGVELYSFSGHGAPLTPEREKAAAYSRQFRRACELMERVGVPRMALVAGLPAAAEGDSMPNWITNADAHGLCGALEWQWEKRLLPFWREHGKIARDHGVTLCFEMQINDMLHTPVKLRQLHDELGPVVACNFDISHMWVQGIDPFEAMHYLGDLIQNVHLKDTLIHQSNCRLRGMFDTTGSEAYRQRGWTFAPPGWGHGEQTWREVIATLRFLGYEGILSLEMESEYMEMQEGLEKAAAFIRPLVLELPPGPPWWQIMGMDED